MLVRTQVYVVVEVPDDTLMREFRDMIRDGRAKIVRLEWDELVHEAKAEEEVFRQ